MSRPIVVGFSFGPRKRGTWSGCLPKPAGYNLPQLQNGSNGSEINHEPYYMQHKQHGQANGRKGHRSRLRKQSGI
jgi:hypothetical protein